MDFVNKQHIVLFQVGQECRQVFGLFQHRAAGLAQIDAQLVGNDVAQRRLTQTRRAKQQHVVERFVALFGCSNKNLQLLAHLGLAHIVVQQFGAQGALNGFFSA